jgi:hypothetical protein
MVWGTRYGGGFGHVAVATGEGDTNRFRSLDQNWNNPSLTVGSPAAFIWHSYDGVLGWLEPIEATAANPTPTPVPAPADIPAPAQENIGIVNGEGLRGRNQPSATGAVPYVFFDRDTVVIHSKAKGERITVGPYQPSDWWYYVQEFDRATSAPKAGAPAVWVSDAFIRTKSTPAKVPDYVAPAPSPQVPNPPAPPKPGPLDTTVIVDTPDSPFVTEFVGSAHGNFHITRKNLRLPSEVPSDITDEQILALDRPENEVLYIIFHNPATTNESSVINEFKSFKLKSAQYLVGAAEKVYQFVKERHTSFNAGNYVYNLQGIGIEVLNGQSASAVIPKLVADIWERHPKLAKRREAMVRHDDVPNVATACPTEIDSAKIDAYYESAVRLYEEKHPVSKPPASQPSNPDDIKALTELVRQILAKLDLLIGKFTGVFK